MDGHTASAGPAGSRPEPVRRPQTDTLPTFTPLDNPLRLAYGVGPTALRPQLPAGAARPGWRRLGRPKSRSRRRPPASSRIGRPTRPLGDPRWSPRPPRLGAPREGGGPATLHRPGRPLRAQARRRECRRDVDDFGLRDGGEEQCDQSANKMAPLLLWRLGVGRARGRWPPFCLVFASLCPSQLTAITLPPPLARAAPSSEGAEGASAQS